MTKHTQEKLQEILKTQSYKVRYEKGSFAGGYCIVQDQKVIIINKFHPLESKIGTLMEIIRQIELDLTLLSDSQQKLVHQIHQASQPPA